MGTSRLDAVLDALVTLFDAATTAPVADGLYDPNVDPDARMGVMVGNSRDLEDDEAGSTEQEWRGLGAMSKRENGAVTCAAFSWDGDTAPARRTAVYDLLAACENALRADASLGGVVQFAGISSTRLVQGVDDRGAYARVVFTVTYAGLI